MFSPKKRRKERIRESEEFQEVLDEEREIIRAEYNVEVKSLNETISDLRMKLISQRREFEKKNQDEIDALMLENESKIKELSEIYKSSLLKITEDAVMNVSEIGNDFEKSLVKIKHENNQARSVESESYKQRVDVLDEINRQGRANLKIREKAYNAMYSGARELILDSIKVAALTKAEYKMLEAYRFHSHNLMGNILEGQKKSSDNIHDLERILEKMNNLELPVIETDDKGNPMVTFGERVE